MADLQFNFPLERQVWPCGPDCEYARSMPGTYGEWHWCHHPEFGGRLARDGRECRHYRAATRLPDATTPAHWLG